ncbi:MAG: hypothetical protein HQM10_01645 [Candidatus Riflebacteria bacterium]|nr:hypothetical protein [Candidatus Riflebacteria bacterium]
MKLNNHNNNSTLSLLFVACFLMISASLFASDRNLIPRMPEFVIEKGFSDAFEVIECVAKAELINDYAQTSLLIKMKNVSEKKLNSSIKVRLLYLINEAAATLEVNGKRVNFSRDNPRIPVTMEPGEILSLQVRAKQGINFNLDAENMKVQSEPSDDENKSSKKKFALDDLTKLFERENLGRRFMVGPLISKWGIFPLDFKKISIQIQTPSDFEGVFSDPNLWKKKAQSGGKHFVCENGESFQGSVFLPAVDAEKFRSTYQKKASQPSNLK